MEGLGAGARVSGQRGRAGLGVRAVSLFGDSISPSLDQALTTHACRQVPTAVPHSAHNPSVRPEGGLPRGSNSGVPSASSDDPGVLSGNVADGGSPPAVSSAVDEPTFSGESTSSSSGAGGESTAGVPEGGGHPMLEDLGRVSAHPHAVGLGFLIS